jgi:hypothetical protein
MFRKIITLIIILNLIFFVSSDSITVNVDFIAENIGNDQQIADPTIIEDNGDYYIYYTGTDNINILKSENFINWDFLGSTFASNNIQVDGKTQNWDSGQAEGYYYIWAPEIIKHNNSFVLTFSASQGVSSNPEFIPYSTIWFAFSENPYEFTPRNGIRMHEPVPLRNYRWGFSTEKVHSAPTLSGCGSSECKDIARIDSGYFKDDDGTIWMPYVYFDNGNNIGIVKLDPSDLTLTNISNYESYDLVHSLDFSNGITNQFRQNGQEIKLDYGITEAPQIIKRNGKYILFYSTNGWDSDIYTTRYKMADSIACLAHDSENNGCDVKKGTVFDGSASDYSYGHTYHFYGPDEQQIFALITVMKDNDKSYRSIWLVEQEFNSDGSPKSAIPLIEDKVTINGVTVPNEICNSVDDDFDGVVDNGCDDDQDGFADSSMACEGKFMSWHKLGNATTCQTKGITNDGDTSNDWIDMDDWRWYTYNTQTRECWENSNTYGWSNVGDYSDCIAYGYTNDENPDNDWVYNGGERWYYSINQEENSCWVYRSWNCQTNSGDTSDNDPNIHPRAIQQTNTICQQFNERYTKSQLNTEITNWKNGNLSLIEIIRRAQLNKYCN